MLDQNTATTGRWASWNAAAPLEEERWQSNMAHPYTARYIAGMAVVVEAAIATEGGEGDGMGTGATPAGTSAAAAAAARTKTDVRNLHVTS